MNGEGRPSPRTLSQAFMKGEDGLGSLKNRTALSAFFGKFYFKVHLNPFQSRYLLEPHKTDDLMNKQIEFGHH